MLVSNFLKDFLRRHVGWCTFFGLFFGCPLLVHLSNLGLSLVVEPDLLFKLRSGLLVLFALQVVLQLAFFLERLLAHGTTELLNDHFLEVA